MSPQLNESLSAVVDGEASQFETRRVLDELNRDDGLRARWHRYHLIGAALRREGENVEHGRALDRLWQSVDGVDADTLPAVPESVGARHRRRARLTAAAVAASVALAVVVAFYPGGGSTLENAPAAGIGDSLASVGPLIGDSVAPVVAERADDRLVRVLPSESDVRRTRAYMLRHAHHMALTQRAAGTVPFVKVAAFEGR